MTGTAATMAAAINVWAQAPCWRNDHPSPKRDARCAPHLHSYMPTIDIDVYTDVA